jgi:hypothetical protein
MIAFLVAVGLLTLWASPRACAEGKERHGRHARGMKDKNKGDNKPKNKGPKDKGPAKKDNAKKQDGHKKADGNMPKGIYVRITPMDSPMKGVGQTAVWVRKNHTAQDILGMISQLKPDVIDRFTTGKQNPSYQVPGSPQMNLVQFYNAAMAAGAPGCIFTAKVHLNDVWPDDYRMAAARSLRDLPVTPRLTALDLDAYFDGGGPKEHKRVLQQFKDMGWTDLGFNTGTPKKMYGYGSFAMAPVNRNTWNVTKAQINELKQKGVRTPLIHIDYPRAIDEFKEMKPDRQAKILREIHQDQHQHGFRFIYPVLYSGYDSTKIVTSKNGPFHGQTIFEVIKHLIEKDRAHAAGGGKGGGGGGDGNKKNQKKKK